MALILLAALLTVPEVALATIDTTFGEPLDTVQDIVGGLRNQLAATLAVRPVLLGSVPQDRLAAQPVRFFNAGDGKWQYANVGGVGHLAKSFIVLF